MDPAYGLALTSDQTDKSFAQHDQHTEIHCPPMMVEHIDYSTIPTAENRWRRVVNSATLLWQYSHSRLGHKKLSVVRICSCSHHFGLVSSEMLHWPCNLLTCFSFVPSWLAPNIQRRAAEHQQQRRQDVFDIAYMSNEVPNNEVASEISFDYDLVCYVAHNLRAMRDFFQADLSPDCCIEFCRMQVELFDTWDIETEDGNENDARRKISEPCLFKAGLLTLMFNFTSKVASTGLLSLIEDIECLETRVCFWGDKLRGDLYDYTLSILMLFAGGVDAQAVLTDEAALYRVCRALAHVAYYNLSFQLAILRKV